MATTLINNLEQWRATNAQYCRCSRCWPCSDDHVLVETILGVAIGLALAVLLVLLIVLYCCEKYRHSKRFGKLLRRLGAPQAEDNAFDELDYGRKEAWRDETQSESQKNDTPSICHK